MIRVEVDSKELRILMKNLSNFGKEVQDEAQGVIERNSHDLKGYYRNAIPLGNRKKHLRDSVKEQILRLDAMVGSTSPLARIFESGHKSYTTKPKVKKVLHWDDVYIKSARIPAVDGTRALENSYNKIKPRVADELSEVLENALRR